MVRGYLTQNTMRNKVNIELEITNDIYQITVIDYTHHIGGSDASDIDCTGFEEYELLTITRNGESVDEGDLSHFILEEIEKEVSDYFRGW